MSVLYKIKIATFWKQNTTEKIVTVEFKRYLMWFKGAEEFWFKFIAVALDKIYVLISSSSRLIVDS